ncbi:MAG: 4Fe-4S binding protein [Tannerella sp.]|jgi:ferredoxin|nr:4Fe-4S binding protein [Tannerella sp.]
MTYYIIGALVVIWSVGGIYRHIRGRGKTIRVTEDNCTGCGKCLKKCRRNVFEMVKRHQDEKFFTPTHVIVKNPQNCTACGDCVGACKFKALELYFARDRFVQ